MISSATEGEHDAAAYLYTILLYRDCQGWDLDRSARGLPKRLLVDWRGSGPKTVGGS
jgi:hypothetical protein